MEKKQPIIGRRLSNGATIVAIEYVGDDQEFDEYGHAYPVGRFVVLCTWSDPTPYVTWHFRFPELCDGGRYHRSFLGAVKDFQERVSALRARYGILSAVQN